MESNTKADADRAQNAAAEEIPVLLYATSEEVLLALLENPRLEEPHLCLLLERKDLPAALLEEIARRKQFQRSYCVRRALVRHPHTPRLVAMRLARSLYLMDLVQLSLLVSAPAELRKLAEELVLVRIPQLPLGQKLMLARRGSARVAGALLAEGHPQVARIALDNAFLTEAQVLRVLARPSLSARVVAAIAQHPKWSCMPNVRLALVRQPSTPLERLLAFLPNLTLRDLKDLVESPRLSPNLRQYIRHEIAQRSAHGPRDLAK